MKSLSEISTDEANNSALLPGTVLQDRYRIVRQLGRGGMGAVYEAEDLRLAIRVALKETLSSEPGRRKQFEHEAQLLAGMQHSALPRVSDHFLERERAFLVMEFIGGVDLARIIAQQPGPFPRDCVIAWADQLLDALIYLHSRDRQVIHRDIKPHNLKLTAGGKIALLDFGLAKAQTTDSSVTSSRAFFGYTRHYAPLEQIQDQRTDQRSDIYALGATLYHLLTGTKPADAMVRATARENSEADPLRSADKIHPAVGPQIAAILDKALAQNPEDRYATASEFREALRCMGRVSTIWENTSVNGGSRIVSSGNGLSDPAVATNGVKMTLVVSARRFGPAAYTAVVVGLLTVGAGILYGSERWFNPVQERPAVSSVTGAAPRQTFAGRKPERARPAETPILAGVKKSNSNGAASVGVAGENGEAEVLENSQSVAGRESSAIELRRSRPRISPPRIRLPNPEWNDAALAPPSDSPNRE